MKLLNRAYEEANAPETFYDLHEICRNLKISAPRMDDVFESLKKKGYFVSRTHFKPIGIKTDAPLETLKEIVSCLKPD